MDRKEPSSTGGTTDAPSDGGASPGSGGTTSEVEETGGSGGGAGSAQEVTGGGAGTGGQSSPEGGPPPNMPDPVNANAEVLVSQLPGVTSMTMGYEHLGYATGAEDGLWTFPLSTKNARPTHRVGLRYIEISQLHSIGGGFYYIQNGDVRIMPVVGNADPVLGLPGPIESYTTTSTALVYWDATCNLQWADQFGARPTWLYTGKGTCKPNGFKLAADSDVVATSYDSTVDSTENSWLLNGSLLTNPVSVLKNYVGTSGVYRVLGTWRTQIYYVEALPNKEPKVFRYSTQVPWTTQPVSCSPAVPDAVAFDDSYVYCASGAAVYRLPLTLQGAAKLFFSGTAIAAFAVDSAFAYIADTLPSDGARIVRVSTVAP